LLGVLKFPGARLAEGAIQRRRVEPLGPIRSASEPSIEGRAQSSKMTE
jgi:hypothetical protein